MKKRILSLFLTLIMAMTLMPVSALAAEPDATPAEIYVSSSGNDATGYGTKDSPYATLAKAVYIAPDGATIYVMTDLSMTQCARFYDKHLTITSSGEDAVTITRGDSFGMQSDNARRWYNPAMIEVQTTSSSAGLTLTNIILDDDGKHMGTVFAQASSGEENTDNTKEENTDNTKYVQDAIIASNATMPCTITLGEGAILRNFGGMSAVRVTDQAKLVMKSGSVIEDTIEDFNRTKGTATDEVGPAGAVWLQGAIFEMEDGAVISNINGRAVYVDGGEAAIGGKISNITGNNKMWQGTSGTALHLRNKAECVLKGTGIIENITSGSAVFCNKSTFNMEQGSVIKDGKTLGVFANDHSTVSIAGQITGLTGGAINLQTNTDGVLLPGSSIDHNSNSIWIVYLNDGATLDIFGKINDNQSEGTANCAALYVVSNGAPAHAILEKGGEICNNKNNGTKYGAAVELQQGECSFTMNGGTITGNCGPFGAVYVHKGNNALIVNNGTIENNVCTGSNKEANVFLDGNGAATAQLNSGNSGNIESITVSSSVTGDFTKGSVFIGNTSSLKDNRVRMLTNSKTVTPASDSLNIKLCNATENSITALDAASQNNGWGAPLATFWAQRTGAATLTVGGLSLNNSLPVYVLTQKTRADGKPDDGAAVKVYAAAVEDGNVSFTLPTADVNGNGCAIAIVQPTDDYGTLTISGPETIKQNKANADYSVTYTVTYTMSENLKSIIAQTGGNATYDLAVNADTRLSGTPGSFDGNCIQVTYTLPNSAFNVGDILYASAELTIAIGVETYKVPSNVAETRLTGLGSFNVMFDWNDGSGKTETISVVEGEALGDQMIANPTRSGYTFTGWNTQADGRGTAFTSATVVNSDLTVYAQWQKNSSDSDNSGSSGTPSGLNTKDHYSYIIGYQDGTLQPYGTITRGEVATIFFRLLTEETREANWSTTNNYADCSPDLWCNNAISTLTRMGIIEGFEDGTFRPNARITRAQFAKIAVGFFETTKEDYAGFFTDVNIGAWYTEYVEAAAHVGLIEGFGDGTFRPDTNITRAQACVIVNRALGRKPDEEHLLNDDEMLTWPDNNPDDWFYADMQEATNSHDYSWITVNDKDGGRVKIENWTEKLPQRDWIAFEHAWSTAYSAPGGEVTQ